MAGSTLTTFDFALKEYYTKQRVENLCFADRPLLAKLAKDTSLAGDICIEPLVIAPPAGVSGQLGASYLDLARDGTGGNVQGKKFACTIGEYHGEVLIGDKVIMASRSNEGAFLENKRVEIDSLYERMSDSLATYLYRNGGKALGEIAAGGITGEVATLTNPEDVANFYLGQYTQADTVDGTSGTLHAGYSYVTERDLENGTVTFEDISDMTGAAAGDFLFNLGDAGITSTIITGLGGWIPAASSGIADLFGVVRSSDATLLGGVRVKSSSLTGLGALQRISKLITQMTGVVRGPGPDAVFVNPSDWQNIADSLQSQGVRPLQEDDAQFGFMKIKVIAGGRVVDVYADRHAQPGTAFALKLSTWKLRSMGELIHTLAGDGLQMLRVAGSTNYSYRLVSYPCFTCNAPGWNGRVAL